MRRLPYAAGLLLALAPALFAAPPDVPAQLTVQPGQVVRIVAKGDPTKIGTLQNFKDEDALFEELAAKGKDPGKRYMFQAMKPGVYVVGFFTLGETEGVTTTITVPAPAPTPVLPPVVPPKPDDPAPAPLTSFRVVLIYESADTLTAAQRAVVYGKAVEDWLTTNCTGGKNGWRRRDKDAPGDADPTMAALWTAVQPKVTVTPCVAVERNGKVDIVTLEATPAAMTTVLQTYRGK